MVKRNGVEDTALEGHGARWSPYHRRACRNLFIEFEYRQHAERLRGRYISLKAEPMTEQGIFDDGLA